LTSVPPDPALTSLRGDPRAVLGGQLQQLAFYEAAPRDADRGDAIDRDSLPMEVVRVLDAYEQAHPGIRLRPTRLVQFDGRNPSTHRSTSAPLPGLDELVTLSVTESVVTAEALTVRSWIVFAACEPAA
jgi:hypothetical protein